MSLSGDHLLGFTLPRRGARGRLVRLDQLVDDILSAHAYPPAVARLLAEALVLVAILGDLLRPDEGQLTLQARAEEGAVPLLVADWRAAELRGYAAVEPGAALPSDPRPSLKGLMGVGYLAITLERTEASERYQGIVALGDTCLEDTAERYFGDSEQVPTLIRLAAGQDEAGRWTAGGILIQQLPRSEDGGPRLHVERSDAEDWAHVSALAGTLGDEELTDRGLTAEGLLWRLFHEDEVRVLPGRHLARGCRCSIDHIRRVIARFPEAERQTMRNEAGVIQVDCEYCSRQFLVEA